MSKRGGIVLGSVLALSGAITVVAQQPAGLPQPSSEHKKLGVFVGTWKDEAEMKPGPFGPGGKMSLTETCEWFAGRIEHGRQGDPGAIYDRTTVCGRRNDEDRSLG